MAPTKSFQSIYNISIKVWLEERLFEVYTLIVRKTLKPSRAVLMTRPGTWGCHRLSRTSRWPLCRKRSCTGRLKSRLSSLSAASCSKLKSHRLVVSSSELATKIPASVGCHSIEVIAELWNWGRECRVNEWINQNCKHKMNHEGFDR